MSSGPTPNSVLTDARSRKPDPPATRMHSPVASCDPSGESSQPDAPKLEPWIPESRFPPLPKDSCNSNIRNILLTSPYFPRLYADVILHYFPNSNEAKVLRPHYQKICEKVNHMSHDGTCSHIKVTGVRCGSPALQGEQFCYFHQNAHRTVRRPKQSRLHPVALIEDEESIQYALMEVINALMRNTIDPKRAALILRALHIAVKNAARVKYNIHSREMVTEIPKYAEPDCDEDFDQSSQIDLPYSAFVPPKSERQIMEDKARAQKAQQCRDEQAAIRANLQRAAQSVVTTTRVGTTTLVTSATADVQAKAQPSAPTTQPPPRVGEDAFVLPASPGEARASLPAAATTAHPSTPTAVPPHNFQKPPLTPSQSETASPSAQEKSAPQRKPPGSATTPVPKERKHAAHRASGG